jgi:hypothetical protein
MQQFESVIPGTRKMEVSPSVSAKIANEAIADIAGVSGKFLKQINRAREWEEFLTATQHSKEEFIEKNSLNENQKQKIEAIYGLTSALYREWSRRQQNPDILKLNTENAAWQQEIGDLIFSHRDNPDVLSEINKYWELTGKLGFKILWDKEFNTKQRRGVERFVATACVLDKFGYSLEAPGGKADAEAQLDLIGQKQVGEKVVAIWAQIKPQKKDQEEYASMEVYPAQLDQKKGQYVSPEVQRLITFAQKNQTKLTKTVLVPVEINISAGTGLLNQKALDNLSEDLLESFKFAESLSSQKKV